MFKTKDLAEKCAFKAKGDVHFMQDFCHARQKRQMDKQTDVDEKLYILYTVLILRI